DYGLTIEENGQGAGDEVFGSHGVKLFIGPISIRYLSGAEVDFVDTITGGGFTIKNPHATSACGCGSSFSAEKSSHGHDPGPSGHRLSPGRRGQTVGQGRPHCGSVPPAGGATESGRSGGCHRE